MKVKKSLIAFTLIVYGLTVNAQVLEQDSLALVAFYNATGGPNWADHTNWLQPGKNVSTWYGIGLIGDRVESIVLSNNNLTDHIPEEIGNLFQLDFLDLESNHLSGTIPASLNNIDKLIYIFLSYNEYTGEIPAFLLEVPPPANGGYKRRVFVDNNNFTSVQNWNSNLITNLQGLSIENNKLDFQDIEPFLTESIPILTYDPQQPLYTADEITLREGAALTLKTTAGGSANNYQWFKGGIAISSATQADHTLEVTLADEGEYTAQITSDIVTGLTLERNPVTLHVKADTVYTSCNGLAITLNASVSDPQATYLWSNGQSTSSIVANVSGKYGVQVETTNYILKDTLEVVIRPKLSLGTDIDTCEPSVQLSSNVAADSYQWQTPGSMPENQSAITATASGRYILEINIAGCVQKDTVEITLNRFTEGDFVMTPGGTELEDNGILLSHISVTFTNTTGTGDNFIWSFGDSNTSSVEVPSHSYSKAGQYTVTLSGMDSRDCPISIAKTINVQDLVITNAISPNGDGKNDKLYVEPFLYKTELKIINRWGQSVYETSSYTNDFNGRNLESGVYYYELFFKDLDKRYKGYVHIMK